MSVSNIAETLKIEASAKAQGWTEDQLLELAGCGIGRAIGRFFPRPGTVIAYLGKGHNAADALIALKVLRDRYAWKIGTRLAYPIADCAPLMREKWLELGAHQPLHHAPAKQDQEGPLLLLDALLGSGSSGNLRTNLLPLAEEMAALRNHAGARIAAIDLPSGIDPNSGEIFPGTVTADITFMIGHAKCGLLKGHAAPATGALAIVPVGPLSAPDRGSHELISPQTLHFGKSPRSYDFHKGMAGRIAILAGSEDYPGAAVLAALGALRGGGGLITLFVPPHIRSLIAIKCPPEIMIRGIENPREILKFQFDALVLGCGLSELTSQKKEGLLELISDCEAPTVIDADALNCIARSPDFFHFKTNHLLTPHPGEFARLAPDLAKLPRETAAREFTDRCAATLLLKGCRTLITRKGEPLWSNSTGTPAMATGGQGDLLAGVIGARLAVNDSLIEAASLAAWVCGRSAEIALTHQNISEESLVPSDVVHHLGAAYQDWKNGNR